jgi:hypothetical protein
MKNLILISLLFFAFFSCTQQKEIAKSKAVVQAVSVDSTEYEIMIIDPDFDTWYLVNFAPSLDRSDDYYRLKNTVAVNNWNHYYISGRYSRIIGSHIHYVPSTDYGIEVNRKLYWFFKYYEEKSRVPLFK